MGLTEEMTGADPAVAVEAATPDDKTSVADADRVNMSTKTAAKRLGNLVPSKPTSREAHIGVLEEKRFDKKN